MKAVAGLPCSEYLRGMRAAVLLLIGCTLPKSDPRPGDESHSVGDTTPPWGPAALQVSPDAVDFGIVELGESVSRSIELANVGGDVLALDEIRLADADPTIELDWTGGGTLSSGASAGLSLTWLPTRAQDLKNELRIGSSDPVAPFLFVSLTGVTVTPRIEVDPTSTDFGSMPIGFSTIQPIAIRNVGHGDLEIESVSYMPSDPDDLAYFPGSDPQEPKSALVFPLTIAPGEERTVTITYAPHDERDDQGVLTVTSNDPDTPQVHAEQHGSGVADPDTGT